MKRVGENNRLWYRRSFELPAPWSGRRILLHFEAVDWETTVWVNGKELGIHRGGYDRFSFDITDALKASGKQEVVVAVWDSNEKSYQARGKQVTEPHSIWYTPTTGIWQTVWLEPVNREVYVKGLRIIPDVDAGEVRVAVSFSQAMADVRAVVEVHDEGRAIARARGASDTELRLAIPDAKLWSPDSPYLYDLRVAIRRRREALDEVTSCFGMRKVSLGKDENGITRIFLNNKPLFMFGPLDQGFWPDGVYTAPTDEALRYDIEVTKQLGFNMCRKHVKVEPERWYYWADKLGLLVWQDMPSGDRFASRGQGEITRSKESAEQFEKELTALVETHFNHPCIVMWVPFNEGWGQYETARIVEKIKALDPTRLVDCASGWNDVPVGDVHDIHSYPGPAAVSPEPNRAAVLGEFGGLGLPLRGHTWQDEKNWGYRSFEDSESLTKAYLALLEKLRPLIQSPGLSAAVYTQTTDVEIEVNGLMTYDRAVIKMNPERITAENRKVIVINK
jgi:beta-galactosidase/beta-glucuronidase